MANSLRQTEPQPILSGWKEIANHLGKGVRTVQRYERDLGLPVRRPSRESGVVFAITSELDAWVDTCPMRTAVRSIGAMPKPLETSFQSLRKNVEEMRRLGKQMRELKGELRQSLQTLRAHLRFVETDAHAQLSQPGASGLATSVEAIGLRMNSIQSKQTFAARNESLLQSQEGPVR